MSTQYQKQKEKWRKQGMEEGRVSIIKIIDKRLIRDLYGCDKLTTENYDIIIREWEKIKKEISPKV